MLCLRGSAFVIVDYPSGLTTNESRFQTNKKQALGKQKENSRFGKIGTQCKRSDS